MRNVSAVVGCAVILALSASIVSAQSPAGQPAPAGQAAAPARGPAAPPAPTPASCGPNPPADMKNVAADSRCFELRKYTLRPEGPGDPNLLHQRFREQTLVYFKKHNMAVVGFWQPVSQPDALIYLLAFRDAATRDAAWAAFNADPGWVKARTDMRVGVVVENTFMISTDYGPMK